MKKSEYRSPETAVLEASFPQLLSNTITGNQVKPKPDEAEEIDGEECLSKGNGFDVLSGDMWGEQI